MQIEFVGEDDSRVGFKKGQRVEVDDEAAFPRDFRKVTSPAPPPDPDPDDDAPTSVPNPDDDNKEGE